MKSTTTYILILITWYKKHAKRFEIGNSIGKNLHCAIRKKAIKQKKSSSGWRWIPRDAKIRNGDAKIWWCYKQTPVNADCIFSTTTYNDLKQLCASTQAFDGTYT